MTPLHECSRVFRWEIANTWNAFQSNKYQTPDFHTNSYISIQAQLSITHITLGLPTHKAKKNFAERGKA